MPRRQTPEMSTRRRESEFGAPAGVPHGIWNETPRARSPSAVPFLDLVFGVATMLILCGGVMDLLLLSPGSGAVSAGSPAQQVTLLSLTGFCILLLAMQGLTRVDRASIWRAWPMLLLVGWCALSVIWSTEPGLSLRRTIGLVCSLIPILYLTLRYTPRQLLTMIEYVAWCFVIITLVSIVLGTGVERGGSWDGAWKGLTGQKNQFGRFAACFILVIAGTIFSGHLRVTLRRVALLTTLLVMLVLSQSQTPLVAFITCLIALPVMLVVLRGGLGGIRFSSGVRTTLALTIPLVCAYVAFQVVPFIVVEVLGKDLTFSGRINIWEYAFLFTEDRPWLGAGYRTFWVGDVASRYFDYFSWKEDIGEGALDHSHSSYVDTYDELGLIGVGMLCLLLISSLRPAPKRTQPIYDVAQTMTILITTMLLINAFTERVVLQYLDPVWGMFSLAYFSLAAAEARGAIAEQSSQDFR